MPNTIQPATNRLLVELVPIDDPIYSLPASSLILPTQTDEEQVRSNLFRVLAVGEQVKINGLYAVGDIIIKANFASGAAVIYAGKPYLLLSEGDILCKIIPELIPTQVN